MLHPLTAHHVALVDGSGHGHVERCSMTFQESYGKSQNTLTPNPALTFKSLSLNP